MRALRLQVASLTVATLLALNPAGSAQKAAGSPLALHLGEVQARLGDKDMAGAESAEEALLRQVRERFGRNSEEHADALDQLVGARLDAGSFTGRTLDLSQQAVEVRSQLPEQETLQYRALVRLGYLLHVDGKLEDAKYFLTLSLELLRRHLGPEHPDTAEPLGRLADVEMDLGNLKGSEKKLRRALEIVEEHYGARHEKTGEELFGLALFFFEQERYAEAKEIWERTLAIYRSSGDFDQLSRALHNLGEVSHRLGDIAEAFGYLEDALEIRRRPELKLEYQADSTYAALGDLWFDAGDYERARDYYREALGALEARYGQDPYRYAETRSRLGLLLEESGAFEEALDHQRAVLEIRREKLEANDPRIASTLQRLGMLHLHLGEKETASDLLREALAIQLQTRRPESLELAATRLALAKLEEAAGNRSAAVSRLKDALRDLAPLPRHHPARVELQAALASLLRTRGQLVEARRLVEDGLNVLRQTYGDDSSRGLALLREQAILQLLVADPTALRSALRSEDLRQRHLRTAAQSLPESQAIELIASHEPALGVALSALGMLGAAATPAQVAEVWAGVIGSRAIMFDAVASRQRVVAARADPLLQEAALHLDRSRSRLAHLLVRGRGSFPPDRYADLLRQTRLAVASAERKLAEMSRPLAEEVSRKEIGITSVLRAVPEDSALVAFVRQENYTSEADRTGEPYYTALLQRGEAGQPIAIDLGAASAIEPAIRKWILTAEEGLRGDHATEAAFRTLGREVRARIWDPLQAQLAGVARVFIVADGLLHLVNPAALPSDDGGYVVEEGPAFHFLTSERDLVETIGRAEQGIGMLAVGGPDFSSREAITKFGGRDMVSPGAALARGWPNCRPFEDHWFVPLPATSREAQEIAKLWEEQPKGDGVQESGSLEEVELLIGAAASEEAFKRLAPGRRMIHLATHGFLLQETCAAPEAGNHGGNVEPPEITDRDPMTLSGLALAGANRRKEASAEEEDGILTPLEILGMDLYGVQWAVLSACESGRGEIRNAEGVFGLQRAFILAGAKTVIMSLWRVDDESTRRWMSELYRRRLLADDDTLSAVRRASIEILRARRQDGQSTHPIFWGGFVASGDWK